MTRCAFACRTIIVLGKVQKHVLVVIGKRRSVAWLRPSRHDVSLPSQTRVRGAQARTIREDESVASAIDRVNRVTELLGEKECCLRMIDRARSHISMVELLPKHDLYIS